MPIYINLTSVQDDELQADQATFIQKHELYINKLLQNDSSCTAWCSSLSQSRRSRIESTFPLFLSSFQQVQLYLRQMDCGPSCVPSTWRQGTQYTYTLKYLPIIVHHGVMVDNQIRLTNAQVVIFQPSLTACWSTNDDL